MLYPFRHVNSYSISLKTPHEKPHSWEKHLSSSPLMLFYVEAYFVNNVDIQSVLCCFEDFSYIDFITLGGESFVIHYSDFQAIFGKSILFVRCTDLFHLAIKVSS